VTTEVIILSYLDIVNNYFININIMSYKLLFGVFYQIYNFGAVGNKDELITF